VAEWHAFVAARDAGAGALWLLAGLLGLGVRIVPARFRALALVLLAVYTVGAVCFGM